MQPRFALLLALALAPGLVRAQAAQEPMPPPPLPPQEDAPRPPDPQEGPLAPEITITTRGRQIHEEYRYNGILYRVKVIPRHGPPYWLIYDELGNFRRSDVAPEIAVPQWVIKRF